MSSDKSREESSSWRPVCQYKHRVNGLISSPPQALHFYFLCLSLYLLFSLYNRLIWGWGLELRIHNEVYVSSYCSKKEIVPGGRGWLSGLGGGRERKERKGTEKER
jgi:hypothetical protein